MRPKEEENEAIRITTKTTEAAAIITQKQLVPAEIERLEREKEAKANKSFIEMNMFKFSKTKAAIDALTKTYEKVAKAKSPF